MRPTDPQIVPVKDFSDSDKLSFALLWESSIQSDEWHTIKWHQKGLDAGKARVKVWLERVETYLKSWTDDNVFLVAVRDLDMDQPELSSEDDSGVEQVDESIEGSGIVKKGRIVSLGIWMHQPATWADEPDSKTARIDDTPSIPSKDDNDEIKRPEDHNAIRKAWRKTYFGGKEHYYFFFLSTLPTHQRHGAGSAVTKRIFPYADKLGIPSSIISVPTGLSVYLHCGFRELTHLDADLEKVFGKDGKGHSLYRTTLLIRDAKEARDGKGEAEGEGKQDVDGRASLQVSITYRE